MRRKGEGTQHEPATVELISAGVHRLDAADVTAVIDCRGEMPGIVYLGQQLDPDTDCDSMADALRRPIARGALDVDTQLSLHPESGRGYLGHPALIAHAPTEISTGFDGLFSNVVIKRQASRLQFFCEDKIRGLVLTLDCGIHPDTGVLTLTSSLENTRDVAVEISWLAAGSISLPAWLTEQICFDGAWCREFSLNRLRIPRGMSGHDNRTGRTSHESFPGRVFVEPSTDEDQGQCIGVHLGWSGSHRLIVERLASGEVCVQMGILSLPGEQRLEPNTCLTTPTFYVATSHQGLNALSQRLHQHVRQSIVSFPDESLSRPVTLNTWEAVYFEHDVSRLLTLADQAAALGVERFVLDDGWFKGRHDDTTSLGDWHVDSSKYPDGLHPLVDRVVSNGMQFGLWIEPEMVSPVSDLSASHPDWVLRLPGYQTVTGRQQWVLDVSNPLVSEALYQQIDALLREYTISYLKWDMNRVLVMPGNQQGIPVSIRYTEHLYRLIDRIRNTHPQIEIESCASGGGRIDYEILKRTHRVWPTDSNDPVECWQIQQGFSHFFPPEIMGSHIGPAFSHSSGRGASITFRALAAMYGHFGLEFDISDLTDAETRELSQLVEFYKQHRVLWHSGRFFRLKFVDPQCVGVAVVSPDKSKALAFIAQTGRVKDTLPQPVRLKGLNPKITYAVQAPLIDDNVRRANRARLPILCNKTMNLTGEVLQNSGIQLPILEAQSCLALQVDATALL